MIHINKPDWLMDVFASVRQFTDIHRDPGAHEETIRNTQAQKGEVVRVLGRHRDSSLVMKIDGSKGWIETALLEEEPTLRDFVRPKGGTKSSAEFLGEYRGVPYLLGGISKAGMDCSAFTQLYFLEVHDKIIPRNSKEQRKSVPERPYSTVKNGDLVYALGRVGGSHHVGIFLNGRIWHSYSLEGVVDHDPAKFFELFAVESVNSIHSGVAGLP